MYLFIWLHWASVAAHRIFSRDMRDLQLQHVGSSSLSRDQTRALYIRSVES